MERTRAFYEDALGFPTVKRTENYDDPGTLHYNFSPTRQGEPRNRRLLLRVHAPGEPPYGT